MKLKTDLSAIVVRRNWMPDNDMFITTNPVYSGAYAMTKIEKILIPKGSEYEVIGNDESTKDCKVLKFKKLQMPVSCSEGLL